LAVFNLGNLAQQNNINVLFALPAGSGEGFGHIYNTILEPILPPISGRVSRAAEDACPTNRKSP